MFECDFDENIGVYFFLVPDFRYPSCSSTEQGGKWWTGVSTDDWYSNGYKLCPATHRFVSTHI